MPKISQVLLRSPEFGHLINLHSATMTATIQVYQSKLDKTPLKTKGQERKVIAKDFLSEPIVTNQNDPTKK